MSAIRLSVLRLASSVPGRHSSVSGRFSAPSRFFSEQVARRQVSKEERAALRAARRERAAQALKELDGTPSTEARTNRILMSKWVWYAGLGVPSALLVWGISDENSPPAKFSEIIGLTGLINSVSEKYKKPSHDKLIPDWSQMPNVPHDIPIPPTLVLDLENTLVSATWDRKYGWRHAKRPGVDKFLLDMAQYYEIILYSPSIEDVADPVVNSLDKHGCILHRLYRAQTHYKNGVHIKDLSRLNRNVKQMVVIDDDPEEVQFNPENLIKVKPYTDPSDRADNTLARLTPFLIEIAREGYKDIPTLLSQYQGMDADEIADEQDRRVQYFRESREEKMSRGLGGIAKLARKSTVVPELPPQEATFTPPM